MKSMKSLDNDDTHKRNPLPKGGGFFICLCRTDLLSLYCGTMRTLALGGTTKNYLVIPHISAIFAIQ